MHTKHDVIMHHYQIASPFDLIDATTGKWSGERRFSARDTMENPHVAFDNSLIDLDCTVGEQLYSNIHYISISFKLSDTPPYPCTPARFAITC